MYVFCNYKLKINAIKHLHFDGAPTKLVNFG